jgi:hypothetical protein
MHRPVVVDGRLKKERTVCMTVFDLDDKPGVWFDLEGGGKVQLRVISPEDWIKIRKATVKKSPFVEKVDGVAMVFHQEVIDEDLQMAMIHEMSILDWDGLFDKNKNPIPCTAENKKKLMLKSEYFRNFVNEKLDILRKAESEELEISEKN